MSSLLGDLTWFRGALSLEAAALIWTAGFGFLHLALVAQFQRQQYDLRWIASARDTERGPMTGIGGRLERGYRNFLETFPIFLALDVAALVTGRTNAWTGLGAFTYTWARIAYVPLYASGIPLIRSVAWNVAAFGIIGIFIGVIIG
jgi:uncharacterized MAPEG superfamily protein